MNLVQSGGQCADCSFFDEAILTALEDKRIPYIVAAQLTQTLQQTIYQAGSWWTLEAGLGLTELRDRARAGKSNGA